MLKKWFLLQRQALQTSWSLLLKKPLAAVMTIVVIAFTLSLPMLFWLLTNNLQQITAGWQQGGHVSLYLSVPLSSTEENVLMAQVRQTPGVKDVTLKSATDGLAELQQQDDMHDIMQYLPENPLPAVLEVVPTDEFNTPAQLEQLFQTLKAYPHVEQAKIDLQWINRLYHIVGFITQLTHCIMLLLALAVVLIIANTLRLITHSRQEEIQVLKLIGAPDLFILRPFLYTGMNYGFAGALLAVLIVDGLMYGLRLAVEPLANAYQMHVAKIGLSWQQGCSLIFCALLLGWLGARFSVKRQLAAIEPKA